MIYKRGDYWHMDSAVNGVRYREALDTSDKREAIALEKKRCAEIHQGKGASKAGREFARMPFGDAANLFTEDRTLHVSERTHQLDRERLQPLREYFGERPLLRMKASDISAYQRARLSGTLAIGTTKRRNGRLAVGPRTVNMEVSVLRLMLRRAKLWNIVSEDVQMLHESNGTVAKVLTDEQKRLLFSTAAKNERWLVVHCAAVLAASTTCRGIELKHLRWQDLDLFGQIITIHRSKTDAGRRNIPLTGDAISALARLRERAEGEGVAAPEQYVFPSCESGNVDPTKPQKSWRTAWRSLVKQTAKQASEAAGKLANENGGDVEEAMKRAAEPFAGFRFHDLRHQAITEMAEAGASDATLMAMAGHMSREMLEHYSHVRMQAKRVAVAVLDMGGALMGARQMATVDANDTEVVERVN